MNLWYANHAYRLSVSKGRSGSPRTRMTTTENLAGSGASILLAYRYRGFIEVGAGREM